MASSDCVAGPAQGVLEYEVRKFRLGLDGDLTEFQGPPSPELDSHWSSLYDSESPQLISTRKSSYRSSIQWGSIAFRSPWPLSCQTRPYCFLTTQKSAI